MIFLGTTFCGAKHSIDISPTSTDAFNCMVLSNGVHGSLFASKTLYSDWTGNSSYPWDYDTMLFADFNENLLAGNINYTAESVDKVKIKRRRKGTYEYKTLYDIPITSHNDFKFEKFDYLASAGEYEYALVSSVNGIEGNINSNSVLSKFEGLFLVDYTAAYHAILNLELRHKRNREGSSIKTLGSRTPFYVSNGMSNYTSGSIKATFIQNTNDGGWDVENGWKYREDVNDFLTNGIPKIIKNFEGKMWLVHILPDTIDEQYEHYQNVIHSFDWEECGDVENVDDLYYAGLINVEDRR